MREFFSGWRRKVGCVTLVMALALCAGWVRGNAIMDQIVLGTSVSLHEWRASSEGLSWTRYVALDHPNRWSSQRLNWAQFISGPQQESDNGNQVEVLSQTQRLGMRITEKQTQVGPAYIHRSSTWAIAYWPPPHSADHSLGLPDSLEAAETGETKCVNSSTAGDEKWA